jgi:hypothetical protein
MANVCIFFMDLGEKGEEDHQASGQGVAVLVSHLDEDVINAGLFQAGQGTLQLVPLRARQMRKSLALSCPGALLNRRGQQHKQKQGPEEPMSPLSTSNCTRQISMLFFFLLPYPIHHGGPAHALRRHSGQLCSQRQHP